MFFIYAIKPDIEIYFFAQLLSKGKSEVLDIKPVVFLFMLSVLAATKTLFNKIKIYHIKIVSL